MPVTKAYTTEAKLNTFLGITIASGEADDAINGAVDIIDQYTDRNFIADSEASARYFSGDDSQYLFIDECIEVTKVELALDGYGDSYEELTEDVSNGYYALPRESGDTRRKPIDELHGRGRNWVAGEGNHRITAKWGYSVSVPAAIATAATVLAAGIYNMMRGNGGGSKKSEKIGNYQVTYQTPQEWAALDKAKQIIEQYTKYSL